MDCYIPTGACIDDSFLKRGTPISTLIHDSPDSRGPQNGTHDLGTPPYVPDANMRSSWARAVSFFVHSPIKTSKLTRDL